MQLPGALLVCLCLFAAGAHAQLRTIPEQAKDGLIGHLQNMTLSINGVPVRLAPGVQIRDQDNRLIFPSDIPAGARVRYLLDTDGQVRQVWVLTPGEAKRQQ
jgi:hypothetical protein